MKIFIASDHAGFTAKQNIIEKYKGSKEFPAKYKFVDLGPISEERCDYPEFADKVVLELKKNPGDRGMLICGSGQGMAMRANKYPGIRAALCWNEESAILARQHNDANILCVGGRLADGAVIERIFEAFVSTDFEGGRHADRVRKISNPVS